LCVKKRKRRALFSPRKKKICTEFPFPKGDEIFTKEAFDEIEEQKTRNYSLYNNRAKFFSKKRHERAIYNDLNI
jgi:hypothetical protein